VNIAILCQFYPPEMEPSGMMFNSLARDMASKGHTVSVIAGFANFPFGKFINKKYYEYHRHEKIDGVNVEYVWIIPSNNTGKLRRVLNYISYMLSSFIYCIFTPNKYDAIVATSPSLLAALSGSLASRILRVPFILDIRDIWPESAIQLGHLKNYFIINIAKRISSFCYSVASSIVVATPGMKRDLSRTLPTNLTINVIECGVEINSKYSDKHKISTPFDLEDRNKFIILYSGLHGYAQNLITILLVAKELENNDNIVFYFIGDGPEKATLLKHCESQNLQNVKFIDPVPKARIRDYISAASCGLVPLKNIDIFSTVYPSKTFEYMAYGLPLIVGVPGDISKLIVTAKCGIAVESENVSDYVNAINMMYSDKVQLEKYSINGIKYAKTHFDATVLNERYEDVCRKAIEFHGSLVTTNST
jgi:glycosyltransferase involved in cell wall biosynthesis